MTQENQQQALSSRGPAGRVGKGTRGKRLKNSWRAAKTGESLRSFVRSLGSVDASAWLASKRPSGTPKKERVRPTPAPAAPPVKGKVRK